MSADPADSSGIAADKKAEVDSFGTAPPSGDTASPETPAPIILSPGQLPLPDYELIKPLGQGGFGQVWQARGPGGFQVALKFIRLESSASKAELRSLDLMRNIRHAHLLTMFGNWQIQDYLIIAMELADATLLDRWKEFNANGRPGIPRDELLEYMRESAKGIDYLNTAKHKIPSGEQVGIQHKDIKPQNLLLVGGSVKVADFGLAILLHNTVTTASATMTPAYAAPEFFSGQASRWSDQYSLAVTYCQLLTGRLPFEGNPLQVMAGHVSQKPQLTMLGEGDREVIARALAKKPEERWENCRDFVAKLAGESEKRSVRAVASPPQREAVFDTLHAESTPVPPAAAWQGPANTLTARLAASTARPHRLRRMVVALCICCVLVLGGIWLYSPNILGLPALPLAMNSSPDTPEQPHKKAVAVTPVSVEKEKEAGPLQSSAAVDQEPVVRKPEPLPPANLELDINLANREIRRGLPGSIKFNIRRSGCAGPVLVDVKEPPENILVKPARITADECEGSLELTPNLAAPAGKYSVNVKAQLGQLIAQKEVIVWIENDISLSTPSTCYVDGGKSTVIEVQLIPAPAGALVLSLENLPTGATSEPVEVAPGQRRAELKLEISETAFTETRTINLNAYRKSLLGLATSRLASPLTKKEISLHVTASTPIVVMETSAGTIRLLLYSDKAPITVSHFLAAVDGHYYDKMMFHSVTRQYIQSGAFAPNLAAKPSRPSFKSESDNGLSNERGTIAAVRTTDPNVVSPQFFINGLDNSQFDRGKTDAAGYCVFGRVLSGMEVVDKIRAGRTEERGVHKSVPVEEVVIGSVRREPQPSDVDTQRVLRDLLRQGPLQLNTVDEWHLEPGKSEDLDIVLTRPAVDAIKLVPFSADNFRVASGGFHEI
ncbi:MAG: peptidylprolyl isomerase [Gemmataceae bacterium]